MKKALSVAGILGLAIVTISVSYIQLKPQKISAPAVQTVTVTGHVLLGPTCPVVQVNDHTCDDKPYATRLALTSVDSEKTILEFSSGADGKFSFQTGPGEYMIRSAVLAEVLPICQSNGSFQVRAGLTNDIPVSCDTGIR